LLRRLAALAVVLNLSPAAPGHPGLPHSGIILVLRGSVTLTNAAGLPTHLGPNDYWSPQPLDVASQEIAALIATSDSQLVYLAAPALQEACDSHPPLGASILHGLLAETLAG
jgi:CRP-like cAMP-binding protein